MNCNVWDEKLPSGKSVDVVFSQEGAGQETRVLYQVSRGCRVRGRGAILPVLNATQTLIWFWSYNFYVEKLRSAALIMNKNEATAESMHFPPYLGCYIFRKSRRIKQRYAIYFEQL